MSLFVGNISKNATIAELEDEFKKFGQCNFRNKGNFAFVEYDNENEAEDACESLNKREIAGQNLNIEWSKKSHRYDQSKSNRPASKKEKERCHNCDQLGHYARECRQRRRSRSRSNERRTDRSGYNRRESGGNRDRSTRRRSRSPRGGRDRRSRSRSRTPPRRSSYNRDRDRDDRRSDDRRDSRRDVDRRDDRDSRYSRNRDEGRGRRRYSSSQERAGGNRRRTPSNSPKRERRGSDVKLEKHMSGQNDAPRREDPEHQSNGQAPDVERRD